MVEYFYLIDAKNGEGIKWYIAANDIESSPVIKDNMAYFASSDGFVYAIDYLDGK